MYILSCTYVKYCIESKYFNTKIIFPTKRLEGFCQKSPEKRNILGSALPEVYVKPPSNEESIWGVLPTFSTGQISAVCKDSRRNWP